MLWPLLWQQYYKHLGQRFWRPINGEQVQTIVNSKQVQRATLWAFVWFDLHLLAQLLWLSAPFAFQLWPSPTSIYPGNSASKRANIFCPKNSFKTSHFFRSCITGMTPQGTDHGSDVVCVRRRRIGLIVSAVLVAGIVAVVVAFAGKVNIYIMFSVEKGDRK